MGRPRKTIAELRASGTYRPSRHKEREACNTAPLVTPITAPVVVGSLPCPDGLTGFAANWWGVLAGALVSRVQASDVPLLARACRWLAEEDRCREIAGKIDPTTPEHGRALRAAGVAAAAADRVLSAFGLTPADRMKLPAPTKQPGAISWE